MQVFDDGTFVATLPAMPASTSPQTLTVSSTLSPAVEFTDVLVGDVILCSGQSNAELIVDCTINATVTVADSSRFGAVLRIFQAAEVRSAHTRNALLAVLTQERR